MELLHVTYYANVLLLLNYVQDIQHCVWNKLDALLAMVSLNQDQQLIQKNMLEHIDSKFSSWNDYL